MKKFLFLVLFCAARFSPAQIISTAQIVKFQLQPQPAGNPPFNSAFVYVDQSTGKLRCINASGGSCDPTGGGAPSGPAGGDLSGTYPDPSVTATHLSVPLPRAQGGLNSASAGTGILRDGATPVASELSGDCATSGSNTVICTKTNGVAFAASATTDTTNAANINSGLLAKTQGGTAADNSSVTFPSSGVIATGLGAPSPGTSGGLPYYSSTTALSSSALLTANSPVLGGGAGIAPATATFLTTDGLMELDIGPADTTNNGILGLKGKTSGTFKITAPAAAGTSTNPAIITNVFNLPDGSTAAPAYSFTANAGSGMYESSGSPIIARQGANIAGAFSTGWQMTATLVTGWGSSAIGGAFDTAISRGAAGVVDVGTGAAANTSGKLKAAGYMSVGTKFTTDAGCGTVTTLLGGATAGSFHSNATSCTVVVTMGDTATAPNGWACRANDLTTTADTVIQTATSTTTATFSGTTVSGDVINFSCIGY